MNRIFPLLILITLFAACKNKSESDKWSPSGNAVQDYFYKKGHSFPFYCDSAKPVCKPTDTLLTLGRLNANRKQLADRACILIHDKLNTDSLLRQCDVGFSVVPVMVYYIDSPIVWYRVIFKEYRNNEGHLTHSTSDWQLTDNNRVMACYHTLEFLVNEDGTLELKCDLK